MNSGDIKTLIVGCGNIAGGFDVGQGGWPSTHAGAYKYHGKFDITACVDPDKTKLEQFAANWAIKHAFSNMEEVKASGLDFDIYEEISKNITSSLNYKLNYKII